jgi:DNA-binding MurR/RpiR family transcriptional regulator
VGRARQRRNLTVIKDLQQRLNRRQATFTPSQRRIATYMLHNLSAIPFETAASLSRRVGVSPMTVGRFLRTIGYRGLGELKDELRHEAPWVKLYRPRVPTHGDPLAQGLQNEIKALAAVYELARGAAWRQVARRIARADKVTVASFPMTRFPGLAFADLLRHVRPNVAFADGSDGAYTDLLLDSTADSCVVLFDVRRYSRHFRLLAEEVRARGIPLMIFTDTLCHWARDLTPSVLMIPATRDLAWHSFGAVVSMFGLMVDAVIEELGDVYQRIEDIGELRGRFTGYEKPARGRVSSPRKR